MNNIHKHPLYTWQDAHGFLRHWFVCGFFSAGVKHGEAPSLYDPKESAEWETDHLKDWGGEAGLLDIPNSDIIAGRKWHAVQADEFEQKLNLNELSINYPAFHEATAENKESEYQWYALAVLDSECVQAVSLKCSIHDGSRIFLNGKLIYDRHFWHGVIYDEECISLKLLKGRNTLLFKNERQAMVARIVDEKDEAPSGLHQMGGNDQAHRVANSAHSMRKLCASLSVEKPFTGTSRAELKQWQQEFRPVFDKGLGKALPKIDSKRMVKGIERVACSGYTRLNVQIPCEGDCWFDARILIPDDHLRNGKTIITPHGHRFLFNHVTGVEDEPQPRWSQIGPKDGNYNEQLAQAGFVTAAFSQRGFDNRNDIADAHACNSLARMAEAMGYRLPRFYLSDINRIADYLGGIDGVDAGHLGLAGLSGGATMSWICGAYESRFAAVATFCGLMRARHWVHTGSCGMQIVPDVFPIGDSGEILSLMAPRALLIAQGRLDATFNIIEAKSIHRDAAKAWKAAGAEDKLELAIIESGHQFHIPTATRFFEKHL